MNAIQKLMFIVLLVYLSGCPSESQVEERGKFWNSSIQSFFGENRTIDELNDWLIVNGAETLRESEDIKDTIEAMKDPTFESNFYYHISRLETIELDGPVCASWHYDLGVWVDESGNVLKHEIQSTGVCL